MERMCCLVAGLVACVVLLSGCGHTAHDPWLDVADAIKDDRLAGVWLANDDGKAPDRDNSDLYIVTPGEAPGVYNVVGYALNSLKEGRDEGRVRPQPIYFEGSLHELEGTYLVQLAGSVPQGIESTQLLEPLFLVFLAKLDGDGLRLNPLDLPDGWEEEGLLYKYKGRNHKGRNQYTFFSDTEALTAFLKRHLGDAALFPDEGFISLVRIRDLHTKAGSIGDEPAGP